MSVPHGIDRSGAAGGSGAQGMSGSLNDLSDPGADRIVFWDDSVGDLDWLSLGTGLSITDTSLALAATLVDVAGLTPTDGGFIVGDGTNFVVESGATARASLGISEVTSPDAAGDFVIGETGSNPVSVVFPLAGSPLINGQLAFSASASILTIAVKNDAGSDPSTSNPVFVRLRQGNPLDGTHAVRKVTGALSVVISNGSTLGHVNGLPYPVNVYALDNSGTIELAVSTKDFGSYSVQSTTAEGGAGAADSATTLYSTTARTSVPIAALLRWESTQTSAGVWASTSGVKDRAPFARTRELGEVVAYAGLTEPPRWLFCYGQAISRTTYAALFTVLSTTYGVGDGSTTFNLPDIRGRVVAGQDDMGGSSANRLTGTSNGVDGDIIGAAGGTQTHTLTVAEMPGHAHPGSTIPSLAAAGIAGNNDVTQEVEDNADGTIPLSIASQGGGAAHNNVQPTIILNYIVYTDVP